MSLRVSNDSIDPSDQTLAQYVLDNWGMALDLYAEVKEFDKDLPYADEFIGSIPTSQIQDRVGDILPVLDQIWETKGNRQFHVALPSQFFSTHYFKVPLPLRDRAFFSSWGSCATALGIAANMLLHGFIDPSDWLFFGAAPLMAPEFTKVIGALKFSKHYQKNLQGSDEKFHARYTIKEKTVLLADNIPLMLLETLLAHEITHHYQHTTPLFAPFAKRKDCFLVKEGMSLLAEKEVGKVLFPESSSHLSHVQNLYSSRREAHLLGDTVLQERYWNDLGKLASESTPKDFAKKNLHQGIGYTAVAIATRKHGRDILPQMMRGNFSCFKA